MTDTCALHQREKEILGVLKNGTKAYACPVCDVPDRSFTGKNIIELARLNGK